MSAEPVPSFVLTLRLSMVGRDVKTYTFGKQEITVGRDPEADVFIDNPGVSREHLRFERAATGSYEVVELGSANGSFLNDQPLSGRVHVRDGDRIRLGKFTLTTHYETDRRDSVPHVPIPDTDQHTMVLTKDEVAKVLELQRRAEIIPPTPPPAVARALGKTDEDSESSGRVSMRAAVLATLVGYAIGAVTGATIAGYFLR